MLIIDCHAHIFPPLAEACGFADAAEKEWFLILCTVQGVGAANREQIEKSFYRAFAFLLPASANFSTARAATIQAARDLYGTSSAAAQAITQAWTAVGVN